MPAPPGNLPARPHRPPPAGAGPSPSTPLDLLLLGLDLKAYLDSQVAAFSVSVTGLWGKVHGKNQQLAIQVS